MKKSEITNKPKRKYVKKATIVNSVIVESAEKKEIPVIIEETEKKETSTVNQYEFAEVRHQLLEFCGKFPTMPYRVVWNFPNLVRVCQGKQGRILGEFRPKSIKYLYDFFQKDILGYFKNTKFSGYFEEKVKLEEVV